LTDKDRADIVGLFAEGWAVRKIARYYEDKCSRRLITFIIFPDRLERMQKQHKLEKHHLKYYNKDKWREEMRRHRKHRAEVFRADPAYIPWTKREHDILIGRRGTVKQILHLLPGRTLQACFTQLSKLKSKSN
jgi:hypothetical protein